MYSQIVFGRDNQIINLNTKIIQKSDEKEILQNSRKGNNDRPPPKWFRCEKNIDNPNKYRAVFSPIIPTCV